jgi:hypothetical protein
MNRPTATITAGTGSRNSAFIRFEITSPHPAGGCPMQRRICKGKRCATTTGGYFSNGRISRDYPLRNGTMRHRKREFHIGGQKGHSKKTLTTAGPFDMLFTLSVTRRFAAVRASLRSLRHKAKALVVGFQCSHFDDS